jgi:multidrug resistance protein, MATE family
MAVMAVGVIAFRHTIPLAFLGATADQVEAAKLASQLLLFGAGFAVFDGVQTVAAGALRGFNDTRVPLVCALLSYFMIGFTTAWLLAYRTGLGPHGVWTGISLGTAAIAFMLVVRFWWLTRNHHLPTPG